MAFKLGKLDPVRLVGVNYLSGYVDSFPTLPETVLPPGVLNWRMFLNDKYGDCTMAAAAHADMAWNMLVNESDPIPSDPEVKKEYFALTGGVDSGLVETTLLAHWKSNGLFGYTIDAYAPVPHTDINAIKQAIAFYGGCYMGVQLPESAQQQFVQDGPSTWSVVPNSPIEGGHAIHAVGYNNLGVQIISWGQVVTCTYEWITKYLDEAYALISKQFVQAGKGPILNLAALTADLEAL